MNDRLEYVDITNRTPLRATAINTTVVGAETDDGRPCCVLCLVIDTNAGNYVIPLGVDLAARIRNQLGAALDMTPADLQRIRDAAITRTLLDGIGEDDQ